MVALAMVRKVFKEQGVVFSYHLTEKRRDGTSIARMLYEKGERNFVVIGGDGTINEVLNGIEDTENVTLAIIPAGTGNDFAFPLGIPEDFWEASQTALIGNTTNVDLMSANGQKVICFATTGVDTEIVKYCNSLPVKTKNCYLKGAIKVFPFYKSKTYTIKFEDGKQIRKKAIFLAVVNNGVLASGINFCPPASCTDGILDLVVVEDRGFLGNLSSLIKIKKGKSLYAKGITHFVGKSFEISSPEMDYFDLDGELREGNSWKIEVIEKGLKISI